MVKINSLKTKDYFFCGLLILIIAFFFRPFFLAGKIPLPADALIGMYHPFRDYLKGQYPRGFPFKNFLITDPVRQQYPWRWLAVKSWKNGQIPGWNPYQMTGMPLLANFQTAAFYPLNILFFFLPFNLAWGILILCQPLLAALFLYFFLRHLKLGPWPAFLGGFCFAFSGFLVAWLEWGTVVQTILWLPLLLLSIDKIIHHSPFIFLHLFFWSGIFVFSLTASFLAGHLQTAFYVLLAAFVYLIWRVYQIKTKRRRKEIVILFALFYILFFHLSLFQWGPTLQLIRLSGRGLDLDWQKPGWFIPWQHLIQFIAPDFFGNPTTMNYWGEWNYAELVGFLGVIPLIFAFLTISSSLKKEVKFFTVVGLLSLSFALPTPWAKIIYQLKLPLLATSQPTRLMGVVNFCLAVLAAFGLEKMMKKKSQIFRLLFLAILIFVSLWLFAFFGRTAPENLLVSRRNLVLPTVILIGFGFLVAAFWLKKLPRRLFLGGLMILTVFDLLRFAQKFTPFSSQEFIFPQTKAVEFLLEKQKEDPPFRLMSVDKRILAPNFASVYQLEELGGYDPLYLLSFAELMAASERGEADISPPFGFNRIITPANFESKIIDFLNVKYILSLRPLESEKLELVFEEGETKIYENKNSFPRAFLVDHYQLAENKQKVIEMLMSEDLDLRQTVVLEEEPGFKQRRCPNLEGRVEVSDYQSERVVLKVETNKPALLVLSDAFYPGWSARVDNQPTIIYRANYHYRAVLIPQGEHRVTFLYSPLKSFLPGS